MLAERVKEWNRESMERGMQQGMQQGARQVLVRQLKRKFGDLPPDIMSQIDQADEEQILQWSDYILTAHTLGDIFGH